MPEAPYSAGPSVPLRQLGIFAGRLVEPALAKVKDQIHRLLVAAAILATGVACLVAGLAYIASSLWHALVPALGTVGADLLLGSLYAILASCLLMAGFGLAK